MQKRWWKSGELWRAGNRRAMSPVLATLTLILFAVVAGAVLMNWSGESGEVSFQPSQEIPVECLPYLQQASCNFLQLGSVIQEQKQLLQEQEATKEG